MVHITGCKISPENGPNYPITIGGRWIANQPICHSGKCVTWDTAIPNANPSKAGCGFVFMNPGLITCILLFYPWKDCAKLPDGKRVFTDLKANYAGKFKYPSDSAEMMLVVDYQWITFFVNNNQVIRFKDDHLNGGGLAFAVASGQTMISEPAVLFRMLNCGNSTDRRNSPDLQQPNVELRHFYQ